MDGVDAERVLVGRRRRSYSWPARVERRRQGGVGVPIALVLEPWRPRALSVDGVGALSGFEGAGQ